MPRYNRNIVENGFKYNNPITQTEAIMALAAMLN
jgi:hypothetical protein